MFDSLRGVEVDTNFKNNYRIHSATSITPSFSIYNSLMIHLFGSCDGVIENKFGYLYYRVFV